MTKEETNFKISQMIKKYPEVLEAIKIAREQGKKIQRENDLKWLTRRLGKGHYVVLDFKDKLKQEISKLLEGEEDIIICIDGKEREGMSTMSMSFGQIPEKQ